MTHQGPFIFQPFSTYNHWTLESSSKISSFRKVFLYWWLTFYSVIPVSQVPEHSVAHYVFLLYYPVTSPSLSMLTTMADKKVCPGFCPQGGYRLLYTCWLESVHWKVKGIQRKASIHFVIRLREDVTETKLLLLGLKNGLEFAWSRHQGCTFVRRKSKEDSLVWLQGL